MAEDRFSPFGVTVEVFNDYIDSLRDADWESPQGAVRLNAGVTLEELAGADFFYNTRVLLRAVLEEGGVGLTATGNLKRTFVEGIYEKLRLPLLLRELRSVSKVINEMDAWDLHCCRIVAQNGKLLAKRNKRLTITKLGRELLADERAGELFRLLFFTYFRKMELGYMINFRPQPVIQDTMAVTLWFLRQFGSNWCPAKDLGARALHPRVRDYIRLHQQGEFDAPEQVVCKYVLAPLKDFGLVECQAESKWWDISSSTVRLSPLFHRFISFAPMVSPMNN